MADGRRASQLGTWSSAILAILGAVYLSVLVLFFGTQGLVFPPPEWVQLTAGVITFLTAPTIVVLFAAIRHVADRDDRVLGTIGLSFAILFAATVSINRFVQLTVIRQAAPGSASADLARFLPYSAGSVMFALEMLGWGFFISLAALSVAPLFAGDRLAGAIRWVLVAFGVLSLLSVVGYMTATPLTAVGFVAWGPLLLALAILLTLYFRRIDTGA